MKYEKLIDHGALRIFSVVAECDTMTQAAARLGITQSAVSQAVKQIETQTGTVLVERRSRPIKLTPSGVVLKEHADRLLKDMRRMLSDVQLAANSILGKLNIGMIDSFGDMIGRQLIKCASNYAAKLSLRSGDVRYLSQAFLDGELDVYITSDQMPERTEFSWFPVLRDPFVLLVADDILPGVKPTAQLLSRELPFIRYGRQSQIGVFVDLISRRLNVQLPESLEIDSTQTIMRFVQSGQGWTITSALCFIRYPELLKNVRIVPLANSANARNIGMLCRDHEMSKVPGKIADDCRHVFDAEIVPKILEHAPWLDEHVHSITDMPVI